MSCGSDFLACARAAGWDGVGTPSHEFTQCWDARTRCNEALTGTAPPPTDTTTPTGTAPSHTAENKHCWDARYACMDSGGDGCGSNFVACITAVETGPPPGQPPSGDTGTAPPHTVENKQCWDERTRCNAAGESGCGSSFLACIEEVGGGIISEPPPGGFPSPGPPGGFPPTDPLDRGEPMGEYQYPQIIQDYMQGLLKKGEELSTRGAVEPTTDVRYQENQQLTQAWQDLLSKATGLDTDYRTEEFEPPQDLADLAGLLTGKAGGLLETPLTADKFGFTPEAQALSGDIVGRGREALTRDLGFDRGALERMFGKGFEGIRGSEAATRDALIRSLSRGGYGGTATERGTMRDLALSTENQITDLMRDLYLADEAQKKQDYLDFSGVARESLGAAQGFETAQEQLDQLREDLAFGRGITGVQTAGDIYGQRASYEFSINEAERLRQAQDEAIRMGRVDEARRIGESATQYEAVAEGLRLQAEQQGFGQQLLARESERADLGFGGEALRTGIESEQILEAINAARRGESNQALQMLMQLMNTLIY